MALKVLMHIALHLSFYYTSINTCVILPCRQPPASRYSPRRTHQWWGWASSTSTSLPLPRPLAPSCLPSRRAWPGWAGPPWPFCGRVVCQKFQRKAKKFTHNPYFSYYQQATQKVDLGSNFGGFTVQYPIFEMILPYPIFDQVGLVSFVLGPSVSFWTPFIHVRPIKEFPPAFQELLIRSHSFLCSRVNTIKNFLAKSTYLFNFQVNVISTHHHIYCILFLILFLLYCSGP